MNHLDEVRQLVRDSWPPSFFVRQCEGPYWWGKVTVCKGCGLRAAYADQHPADPCKRCGERVSESVGKWVDIYRAWWKVWEPRRGFWAVMDSPDQKPKPPAGKVMSQGHVPPKPPPPPPYKYIGP